MKRRLSRDGWAPYLFVTPFVAVFAVFTAYPMVLSIKMAFEQNDGPRVTRYVGLQNFAWMFSDPDFWKAVTNTAVFALASVFIQLTAALGLAMMLNSRQVKGRPLWRMVFFAPVLVGLPFVALLAELVFQKNTGLVNTSLYAITQWLHTQLPRVFGEGFVWNTEFPWLQEYVMPALILTASWLYIGFNMIYFLAALQNVSPELLEAASVDGANGWHRFRHVTLPAIRPVASFVVLLSLIGSVQLFELPYLLLNNSAGPDKQGLTVVMYLYQQGFDRGDLGYASAVGWVIALTLFVLAIGQRYIGRGAEEDL